MRTCEGCQGEAPDGEREPLCYDCLYQRYVAYRAENAKNFQALCDTEQRLARALFPLLPSQPSEHLHQRGQKG